MPSDRARSVSRLAIDQDRALHLSLERGLLLEGHTDPPRLDPFAVAVHRFVAEISSVERVICLQGQQIVAGGRVGWRGTGGPMLPCRLDRSDDVLDQSFVQEMVERTGSGFASCNAVAPSDRGTQRCRVRKGAGRERRRRRCTRRTRKDAASARCRGPRFRPSLDHSFRSVATRRSCRERIDPSTSNRVGPAG